MMGAAAAFEIPLASRGGDLEAACDRVATALRASITVDTGDDVVSALISVAQAAIRDVPPRTIISVPEESLININLDVGCGFNKQPGFVGMDRRPLPGIEIVHEVHDLPWPLKDESCKSVLMSHVLEHLDPRILVELFDEVWRLLKPEGKFIVAVPYAGSVGAYQDPTHVRPGFNERTFWYFCPIVNNEPSPLYNIYKPRPYKIVYEDIQHGQYVNVVLEALKSTPESTGHGEPVKLQLA